jgi:multidrug transporter EmrE-like cation transporter
MPKTDNLMLLVLIYVIFIVVFETLAQHSFKMSHKEGTLTYYLLGVGFYACVGFLLIRSYETNYKSIGIINLLWCSISVITIMLLGYFFWDEKITYNEIVASILIVIGILLIVVEFEQEDIALL